MSGANLDNVKGEGVKWDNFKQKKKSPKSILLGGGGGGSRQRTKNMRGRNLGGGWEWVRWKTSFSQEISAIPHLGGGGG